MSGLRLIKLSTSGLKARDVIYPVGAVSVLRGSNGAGKSAVIQALELGARGEVTGVGAKPDALLRLARGDSMSVRLTFADDAGRELTLHRSWARDSRGRVSEKIEGTLIPPGTSTRDARGAVQLRIGAWAETWSPADLLDLSADKLRRRLIELLGGDLSGAPGYGAVDAPAYLRAALAEGGIAHALIAVGQEINRLQGDTRGAESDGGPAMEPDRSAELAGTKTKLGVLRTEYALTSAHQLDAQRLISARTALDAARSKLGPVPLDLDVARAALEKAAAESHAAAKGAKLGEAARKRAKDALLAAQAIADEVKQISDAIAKWGPTTADLEYSPERLAAARQKNADAHRLYDGIGAELIAARAEARGPMVTGLEHCPGCGLVLAEHYAARAAELQPGIDRIAAALTGAEHAASAATSEEMLEQALETRAYHVRHLAEVHAVAIEAEKEAATLACSGDPVRLAVMLDEARVALKAAEADAEQRRAVQRKAVELARLESEHGDVTAREPGAITAEIRALEIQIAELTAQAERRRIYEAQIGDLDRARAALAEAKAWRDQLKGAEAAVLDRVRAKLEQPLSAALGKPCAIELVDARGNPSCRFTIGGVDASTLSDGERLGFTVGLLGALAGSAYGEWRPLILDRLESVSVDNRARLLGAIVELQRTGAVSNAILAGCVETLPDVPGVSVIDLDAAPSAAEVAA